MSIFNSLRLVSRRARRKSVHARVVFRPRFERLEDRTVPSTVTNLNDSGPGSLRQAILDAESLGGNQTITFAQGVTGILSLATPLPSLNTNIDLEGPGAPSLTVKPMSGLHIAMFDINNSATVTIAGLTVSGGEAPNGGGIFNENGTVTVSNCVISGNTASAGLTTIGVLASGGGIFNKNGTVTVSNCLISGNTASAGGGIANSGTMTLSGSTVTGNSVAGTINDGFINGIPNPFAHYSPSAGGGIYNNGVLTIVNSTIAGNIAGGGSGGGIDNEFSNAATGFFPGTVTVINSTVADNSASSYFFQPLRPTNSIFPANGGGIMNKGGKVVLHNTVIARNTLTPVPGAGVGTGPDVYGAVGSQGYNLVGDGTGSSGFGAAGDQVGSAAAPINPLLSPLEQNGGPIPTLALLPGSPAIDRGDNTGAPATDERGAPRIVNGTIDIGAVEYGSYVPVTTEQMQNFVTLVYQDLLGRTPDTAGLASWVSNFQALLGIGLSPSAAEQQIVYDIETNPAHEYFIDVVHGYYVKYLGRSEGASDAEGFALDVALLSYGAASYPAGLVYAEMQLGCNFMLSPEFASKHGGADNTAFVDGVYQTALGRTASGDAGAANFVTQLNASTMTRYQVVTSVLLSGEYGTDQLTAWYRQCLARALTDSDMAHVQYLAQQVQNGVPDVVIIASIMGDPQQEYFYLAQSP
jgi:hypothetical protein